MKRPRLMMILMLMIISVSQVSVLAAAPQVYFTNPALTPIRESKAFRMFSSRPLSDHSKILFLIDRFAEAPIEILYDGQYYKAAFAANVAKWFMARRYRKESAEQFINKWCNATVPGNNLIWVKFPNGDFKLSREILNSELKQLEQIILEEQDLFSKKKPEPVQISGITPAVAAEMVAQANLEAPAASAIPSPAKESPIAVSKTEPAPSVSAS